MTRRLVVMAAIAAAFSGDALHSAQPRQDPPQVFRARTDLVTVPVFVKGSAGPVAGLAGSDFVLTDNGVAQQVDMIDSEALPVDVTVLVETSRGLAGYAGSINDQVHRIASLVRPADRFELISIGDYVTVLLPFGPPTRPFALDRFTGGGLTSVNDAIVAALIREPDPDRRHLIIALSDTIDTMSTLTMTAVRDVARQSNATLVVAWISLSQDPFFVPPPDDPTKPPPWMTSSERVDRHIRNEGSQRTVPARQQWTPHFDPPPGRTIYAFDALREAADLTGGGVHPPGILIDRNAAVLFDKIYAEFRRNYLLRYLPRGVVREGWHDVTVKVPRFPGLEIRARPGYLVEATPPPVSAPATRPPDGSFAAVLGAGADLESVQSAIAGATDGTALAALIKEFRTASNPWPADPRREFSVALGMAGAAVTSASADLARDAVELLAKYGALVRPPLGPDAFEHDWLVAQAALLEGALQPAEAFPLITAALTRFPDDPDLLLARAIVADQLMVVPSERGGVVMSPRAQRDVLDFYDAAIAHVEVLTEARLRKGCLLRRLGRDDEARVYLTQSIADGNPKLAAWRDLAVTAPSGASLLIEEPTWREFWQGQMRSFPEHLARVWAGMRTPRAY